jgi:PAS domain S-box-containing protein
VYPISPSSTPAQGPSFSGANALDSYILGQIQDIIATSDLNFSLVTLNKAAERYFGFTEAEGRGQRLAELVQFDYINASLE